MEFVSGNIYIRPMTFKAAGECVDGHAHNFDHTTYIVRGAVRVEQLDDAGKVIRAIDKQGGVAQCWVLIRAGVKHRLTALADATVAHCIYAHRTPQGEVVQGFDGWTPAYE